MLLLFNLSFAVLALYFVFKGGVRTEASPGLDYKDFISILLTGLSVMIALGAIFVAVLAIWSYGHFKTITEQAAKEEASATVRKWLSDEAPGIVRENVDFILDASLGNRNDSKAADDLGTAP